MFIRKTIKVDPKTLKEYFSYQLVESIRTNRGPRQNILLTIGNDFDLSKEERKDLANRIDEIVSGINSLFSYPVHIESLAQGFAKQLIQKQSLLCLEVKKEQLTEYHHVNVNSLENENSREIGVEHICLEIFKKLNVDLVLKQNGFTERQIEITAGLIIGRLAGNVSELAIHEWLQKTSGLDELMQTSFNKLSLNTLYKTADSLLAIKKPLEEHLKKKEADLFSFANTVALYDLTNVYCEGQALNNPKAKKGRSKEKRSDCPLITLGVVYNPEGFPLASDIFEGNVSEPKTLEIVLKRLPIDSKTIVVLDGGLGTEANLEWLREHKIPYIVSKRGNSVIPEGLVTECVKQKKGQNVYAAIDRDNRTNEKLVYCQSEAKLASEKKWTNQVQLNFEKALQVISDGLEKKKNKKKYQSVLIRIGRLKEKYSRIAQFYQIDVQADDEHKHAIKITWTCDVEKIINRFDGGYCLRTHGLDWGCEKLWNTYIMLTKAEAGFRYLKSNLGLRPIYHQKEARADSHLFVTLLAYHIMQSILYQLEKKGIFISWDKLRKNLRSHNRITTTFLTKEDKKIHIRATSNPEAFHKDIYSALGLNPKPLAKTKTII